MACLGGLLRGRGDERASYCYILRPDVTALRAWSAVLKLSKTHFQNRCHKCSLIGARADLS